MVEQAHLTLVWDKEAERLRLRQQHPKGKLSSQTTYCRVHAVLNVPISLALASAEAEA